MNLRRGDIVYVAVKGPYTAKPRTALKSSPVGRLDAAELSQLELAIRAWLDL